MLTGTLGDDLLQTPAHSPASTAFDATEQLLQQQHEQLLLAQSTSLGALPCTEGDVAPELLLQYLKTAGRRSMGWLPNVLYASETQAPLLVGVPEAEHASNAHGHSRQTADVAASEEAFDNRSVMHAATAEAAMQEAVNSSHRAAAAATADLDIFADDHVLSDTLAEASADITPDYAATSNLSSRHVLPTVSAAGLPEHSMRHAAAAMLSTQAASDVSLAADWLTTSTAADVAPSASCSSLQASVPAQSSQASAAAVKGMDGTACIYGPEPSQVQPEKGVEATGGIYRHAPSRVQPNQDALPPHLVVPDHTSQQSVAVVQQPRSRTVGDAGERSARDTQSVPCMPGFSDSEVKQLLELMHSMRAGAPRDCQAAVAGEGHDAGSNATAALPTEAKRGTAVAYHMHSHHEHRPPQVHELTSWARSWKFWRAVHAVSYACEAWLVPCITLGACRACCVL